MARFIKFSLVFLCFFILGETGYSQTYKKKKKTHKKRYKYAKVTYPKAIDTNLYRSKINYSINDTTIGDSLYSFAKSFIGVRYRYGGSDPRGFDCSGFVMYCYKNFGYKIPHHAGEQMKIGIPQTESTAQKGDIIYFGYYNRKYKSYYISHSGIVASTDGGKIWFIHSASNAGIRLDCLDQAWYRQRFVGIRRVL